MLLWQGLWASGKDRPPKMLEWEYFARQEKYQCQNPPVTGSSTLLGGAAWGPPSLLAPHRLRLLPLQSIPRAGGWEQLSAS